MLLLDLFQLFYCGIYFGYLTVGLFLFVHVRWILFAPFVSFSFDLIILKLVIFAFLSHYVYVENIWRTNTAIFKNK